MKSADGEIEVVALLVVVGRNLKMLVLSMFGSVPFLGFFPECRIEHGVQFGTLAECRTEYGVRFGSVQFGIRTVFECGFIF